MGQDIFPAVHERLKQAVAAIEPGTSAQPFIDALAELVQAQADAAGFVVLHRLAKILEGTSHPCCPTRPHHQAEPALTASTPPVRYSPCTAPRCGRIPERHRSLQVTRTD